VIIDKNRVVAAKCVLPSTSARVPKNYGMRHRAALGISEITDAVVVVVSEETGGISIAHEGAIERGIPHEMFEARLLAALNETDHERANERGGSRGNARGNRRNAHAHTR